MEMTEVELDKLPLVLIRIKSLCEDELEVYHSDLLVKFVEMIDAEDDRILKLNEVMALNKIERMAQGKQI
ncbi:hypothetical protein [Leptospira adleri]|uniref:Uncharacterized protein n=1 Tax=Leptospira adleri TaxID=2023186 RepID=A0A2M9YJB5_9LEPT|nr:hypothetical protein [Leptospira adleri]PJZ51600.1 hypothetical protein CH380_19330 [Leptospira adleri]PJZ61891.1 hypothetical protein CH376_10835 [Leptospira adleri]